MTNPLAKFLLPDGAARTRDGRVVEGLRSHQEDNAGWLLGNINGSQCLWNTSGMSPGTFRAFDLVPAFTYPFAISGRAFTAELWQTGEGQTARTHLRCTAIDERVRGGKVKTTAFVASNEWRVASNHNPAIGLQSTCLRGDDPGRDNEESSTTGHRAYPAAVALAEALAAWDKELNESERAKSLPTEAAVKEELNNEPDPVPPNWRPIGEVTVAVTLSSIKTEILLAELARRIGGAS